MVKESLNIMRNMSESDKYSNKKKKEFVENLGKLLSYTREPVTGCKLINNDIVEVLLDNGESRKVCIAGDSYLAIIKDVLKMQIFSY